MPDESSPDILEAYAAGRVAGLALAAFTISVLAFLSLLGAEKAIVGLILGTLAYRGASNTSPPGHRLAIAAIAISTVYLLFLAAVLLYAGEDLLNLLKALDKVS